MNAFFFIQIFYYQSPDHQSFYENHRVIAERQQEPYRKRPVHEFFALFPFLNKKYYFPFMHTIRTL